MYPQTLGMVLDRLRPSGRSGCWLRFGFLLLFRLLYELQSGFGFCLRLQLALIQLATLHGSCMLWGHYAFAVLTYSLVSSCFLASWVGAPSPTHAVASTFAILSAMPAPHSMFSQWQSSNFVSLSSRDSFTLRHCTSSHTVCASSILAILSIVWCS